MGEIPTKPKVFAICAHPDDIEFMMAGTLILLGQAGYEMHYMTLANGCYGTAEHSQQVIAKIRRKEAMSACHVIGAHYHESLVDDLEIFYDNSTLHRLGSVIREVAPQIILTHYPNDYMEDHSNTCRLVLTAAFTRGMPFYPVKPEILPIEVPVCIYHCMPNGLYTPLRHKITADYYVNITDVVELKTAMLAQHKSQKNWLDTSQGINSYLITMQEMSAGMGRDAGTYSYAEGWLRHLHLGYAAADFNPLVAALGDQLIVIRE